jgi:hypothetical protein
VWGVLRLAVPALAVAFALLVAGSARAQDRTDFFVQQLERSPVFVSDSIPRRVDDADRAALEREVERMPFPTYVVVAPLLSEEYMGTGDRLALLRDGLGEDGVYLYTDDRGSTLDIVAFGVQLKMRAHDISMATYWDFDREDPVLDKIRYALGLARGEPRMPPAQRARRSPSEGGPDPLDELEVPGERSNAGLGFAIIGTFLVSAGLSATGLERRRRRRLTRGRRHAGSLPAADVREQALDVHARLARAIERERTPRARALDLEAAASMALDRRTPIDDLGALILSERGREALKGRERERCFFDPRHGGRTSPTRWATKRGTVEVPACRRCASAVAARKAPDSLWDDDRPYWQRETVWARTGFGSLRQDMRRALAEDGR